MRDPSFGNASLSRRLAEEVDIWPDGTPEADGVLAMLNAASTTFETLDVDAALDRRAAANLIARRDGPRGAFRTLDEVDAVRWVGPAGLRRLLDYARDNGWVGAQIIEGVALSGEQARAVVQLANEASREVLDVEV
ncbi:MAG: hypothetical protein AAF211_32250, partial [Myxococcota bacterium]